jgi:ribosomal protein L16/L10AE
MPNWKRTVFEVYGPFGRVISRHVCGHDKELHHRALEEARKAVERIHNYGGKAWVRQR